MLQLQTSKGSFTVELFEDKAPITTKNFPDYVDAEVRVGDHGPHKKVPVEPVIIESVKRI